MSVGLNDLVLASLVLNIPCPLFSSALDLPLLGDIQPIGSSHHRSRTTVDWRGRVRVSARVVSVPYEYTDKVSGPNPSITTNHHRFRNHYHRSEHYHNM
jgi:hypothetical protein